MRYFPRAFTSEESNQYIDDQIVQISTAGWGSWAVETLDGEEFIGFAGLSRPASWHPCAGRIEIGWRLAPQYWNRGYATEAATKILDYGFSSIGLDEIVSFTSKCNKPSIRVMQKIGMTDDAKGFMHPRIELTSNLREHVVYQLTKLNWRAGCDEQKG
jgi:ribosomal-protein-alanine N-acetyltransferase